MKAKMTASDYVIVIAMVVIMTVVFVTTLYPFLNALAISLNYADDTILGGITIYPVSYTHLQRSAGCCEASSWRKR